jgi:hypothetical protein
LNADSSNEQSFKALFDVLMLTEINNLNDEQKAGMHNMFKGIDK